MSKIVILCSWPLYVLWKKCTLRYIYHYHHYYYSKMVWLTGPVPKLFFLSITSSHSWLRGRNVMQSEIFERWTVHLSDYKNSPTVTSQKATNFSVIGGASEGILSYCIYLRKAREGTKSFLNLLWDFLGDCDVVKLFIFRSVVSHDCNIVGYKHKAFKWFCWIQ